MNITQSIENALDSQMAGPTARVSDSVGLEWDKFPDDADAVTPGTIL